jgi:hypothetical protein
LVGKIDGPEWIDFAGMESVYFGTAEGWRGKCVVPSADSGEGDESLKSETGKWKNATYEVGVGMHYNTAVQGVQMQKRVSRYLQHIALVRN